MNVFTHIILFIINIFIVKQTTLNDIFKLLITLQLKHGLTLKHTYNI